MKRLLGEFSRVVKQTTAIRLSTLCMFAVAMVILVGAFELLKLWCPWLAVIAAGAAALASLVIEVVRARTNRVDSEETGAQVTARIKGDALFMFSFATSLFAFVSALQNAMAPC